jgi:sensor histidine kinase YesM
MGYCKYLHLRIAMILFLLINFYPSILANSANILESTNVLKPVSYIEMYIDHFNGQSATHIISNNRFEQAMPSMYIFQWSWIRFSVINQTKEQNISLLIQNSRISSIEIYKDSNNKLVKLGVDGSSIATTKGIFANPDYVFNLGLNSIDSGTYYIHLNSLTADFLHMYVGTGSCINNWLNIETNITSILVGVILSLFLYNLFLFISTYDLTYLYFTLSVLFGGFSEITFSGYSFLLFWNHHPELNRFMPIVSAALTQISFSLFSIAFLKTKKNTKFGNRVLHGFILFSCISIVFALFDYYVVGFFLNACIANIQLLVSIIICVYLIKNKYTPAYFYLFCPLISLTYVIISILISSGLLPNPVYMIFMPYLSFSVQTTILAIPLANRINVLIKDKAKSQQHLLLISNENERLIKEQNLILELKINERTEELQKVISDLQIARNDLADLTMSALRLQINPHFIFNCLNSIKLYTLQNDLNTASDYLTKFSSLIRLIMDNSRSSKISLSSEMNALQLYIEMEKMRFKEKLNYNIAIEQNVEPDYIEIPPMLLQPYVENAIWHGLMPKENGGNIFIKVSVVNDKSLLQINIIDDGIGRTKSELIRSKSATSHKSYGMKVTSERVWLINQIYKTGAEIKVHDLTDDQGIGTGTEVIIQVPL